MTVTLDDFFPLLESAPPSIEDSSLQSGGSHVLCPMPLGSCSRCSSFSIDFLQALLSGCSGSQCPRQRGSTIDSCGDAGIVEVDANFVFS